MFKVMLVVVSAIILALVVVFRLGTNHSSAPLSLVTKSPAGTYAVKLKEEINDSSLVTTPNKSDFGRHTVKFDVLRNGQLIIANEPLYTGNAMDSRFIGRYPDHMWLSEFIIRFGVKKDFDQSQDELYVMNNTAHALTYLRIHTFDDEFLLFDLQPNAGVKIPIFLQPTKGVEFNGIMCLGLFDNGRKLSQNYTEFNVSNQDKSPAHYCLSVQDEKVVIVSQEFEGQRSDYTSGTKVRVPKAADCTAQ